MLRIIQRGERFPDSGQSEAYLRVDYWNDYSFITMFDIIIFDDNGKRFDLGAVKIGFIGQDEGVPTYKSLDWPIDKLPENYFSCGQGVEYYSKLRENMPVDQVYGFLRAIRDIAYLPDALAAAEGQKVFNVSLLRSISINSITQQFARVIGGGEVVTDYDFTFCQPSADDKAGIEIRFRVKANSKPSTNIHAIIGRNGVGKTTLLNSMIASIMNPESTAAKFYEEVDCQRLEINSTYFTSLISVSFSAFDPFNPPEERTDPSLGTTYYYVGLKNVSLSDEEALKTLSELNSECASSIIACLSNPIKSPLWHKAIETLESDENFGKMNLRHYGDELDEDKIKHLKHQISRMSSGHAIVLLTISRLIDKVQEKTLILLDEPESHLHPPLLSAFTRALSELLHNRNGVAIVATHSPVVLQEVPKSSAYIITRSRLAMKVSPPRLETFGENVGTLTREVFGLEVAKSGYHALLADDVKNGGDFDAIVGRYGNQIGNEARGLLRAMIVDRDGPERHS